MSSVSVPFILYLYSDFEHVIGDNSLHGFGYSLLHKEVHKDLLTNPGFKHALK